MRRLLKSGYAIIGRFGGSRESSTLIGPCGGEGMKKKQIRLFCIQEGSERLWDFV